MLRKPLDKQFRLMLSAVAILVVTAGYTLLSYRQHVVNSKDVTIPSWRQMSEGLLSTVTVEPEVWARFERHPNTERPRPRLLLDSVMTGGRLFRGLALSVSLALILGVLMGCFPLCESCMLPVLAFLAKVPATAAMPVFFALLTDFSFEWIFAAVVVFGVMPAMAQSIYIAAREVSDEYLYKAYTLGASDYEIISHVIFRSILPHVINAIRLAIGPAIVYLIAAEMINSQVGFGYRIRYEARTGMTVVFPYLMILALFGFGMDYGLRLLLRLVCPWYVPEQSK